jgi:signal peptidase II
MPLPRHPRLIIGLAAALAAFALDQGHKFLMLHVFDIGARPPIRVTSFLDVTLSWNFGISYSLFAAHDGAARAGLLALQLAIVAGLSVWLWRAQSRLVATALGLVIGGALGNVADRLYRGAVADFFYLHTSLPVGPLANYVFNVADVAISLGVALLVLENFVAHPGPSAASEG